MKAIPRELMTQFDILLNAIEIPKDKHGHTKKVAALLSGFLSKVSFRWGSIASLPNFLNKLKEQAHSNSKIERHILSHYFINCFRLNSIIGESV